MTVDLPVKERPDVRRTADAAAESFDRYVAERQAALVRYATLLAGSSHQGEDIVQEVLVRLYPNWTRVAARDPHAYVRRSITNEYLSRRRRWSSRHISVVPDTMLDQVPAAESDDRPDPDLWARLAALPPQQRAAVVLRYYEGLADDEIALALGCRTGTVRAHVSRGLAALRTTMGAAR